MISASLPGTTALDRSKATVNVATRAVMPSPILSCRSEMARWIEDACTKDLGCDAWGEGVMACSASGTVSKWDADIRQVAKSLSLKSSVLLLLLLLLLLDIYPLGWAKPDRH
eukprot:scaffold1902_cov159-Pinguiococcus_pyrenoidosus.AAC.2